MKRIALLLLAGVISIGISRAALQSLAPEGPALSRFLPAGAMLQIQAKDFAALLESFHRSPEKAKWLASSNYEVFSRSRLFLRLRGASDQFATAAGLPPSVEFLSQVAGSRSALALYDIGNLEFLYITRLLSARAMQTALWQDRRKFEPRSAGGTTFYFRSDPESGKQVAFAVQGDYLLLATREDLLAGALKLLSGANDKTMEGETWWSLATGSAAAEGDVRMVLNLEKIVPSPYFRSYWIQQNISEFKQYTAAISDLFSSGTEFREERVLLKKTPGAVEAPDSDGPLAVADLARLVPPQGAIYRVQASPSVDDCAAALETKILTPRLGPAPPSRLAPQFQLASGEVGHAADLETRIDLAPDAPVTNAPGAGAKSLFGRNRVRAILQLQATHRDAGSTFVRFRSAIVFLGESDWDSKANEAALADVLRPGLTTGEMGIAWQTRAGYRELDGLHKLATAVRGKYFFVSDDPELLGLTLARMNEKTAAKPAAFLAGFQHTLERGNFVRLMSALDSGNRASGESEGEERMPQFFSDNITSLSAVFGRISALRIVARDVGSRVTQTVTYEWQP